MQTFRTRIRVACIIAGGAAAGALAVFACGSDSVTPPNDGGTDAPTVDGAVDAALDASLVQCGTWSADTAGTASTRWNDIAIAGGSLLLVSRAESPQTFGGTTLTPAGTDGLFVELDLGALTQVAATVTDLPGPDEYALVGVHPGGDRFFGGGETASIDGGPSTFRVVLERRTSAGTIAWRKSWPAVGDANVLTVLPGGDVLLAGSQSNPTAKTFDGFTTAAASIWAIRVAGDTGAVTWATALGSGGTGQTVVAAPLAGGEIALAAQTRASGKFVGDLLLAQLAANDGAILASTTWYGASTATSPGYSPTTGFVNDPRVVVAGALRGTLGSGASLVDAGGAKLAFLGAYATTDGGPLAWSALSAVGKTSTADPIFTHVIHVGSEIVACTQYGDCEVRSDANGTLLRTFALPVPSQSVDAIREKGGKLYVAGTSSLKIDAAAFLRHRYVTCFVMP